MFKARRSGPGSRLGRLGWAVFSAFAMLLPFSGCDDKKLTGTEVTDPYELAGLVQQENGEPAAGAKVIATATRLDEDALLKAEASGTAGELRSADIAYADSRGEYHFDSLKKGEYNLTIEFTSASDSAKKLAYVWENIKPVPGGIGLRVPVVKVKPPGEVVGTVIEDIDKTNLDSATCMVLGTPYSTLTHLGVFHFNLGEGEYTITCQKTPYAISTYHTEVNSGETKAVQIALQFPPDPPRLPVAANVRYNYDSLTGVVTLSWSKPDFPQLVMYGITRRDSLHQAGALPQLFTTDTTIQDVAFKGQTDTDSVKILFYSIYCLKKDHVFLNGTIPIKVVAKRPSAYGADLSVSFLDVHDAFCRVGDTVSIAASANNAFRDNLSLQWKIQATGETLRTLALTGRASADTLRYPCDSAGTVSIGVLVTDFGGVVSSLYRPLEIRP